MKQKQTNKQKEKQQKIMANCDFISISIQGGERLPSFSVAAKKISALILGQLSIYHVKRKLFKLSGNV